jgi:hypothetical protein
MSQWLDLIHSKNHAYDNGVSGLPTTVVEEALDALAPGTLRFNLVNGYKEQGVDLGAPADKTINLDGRAYQYNGKLTGDVTITVGPTPTAPICASAVLYVEPDGHTVTFVGVDYWVGGAPPALDAKMRYILSTTPTGIVLAEGESASAPAPTIGPPTPPPAPPPTDPKDIYDINIDATGYVSGSNVDWNFYALTHGTQLPYEIPAGTHNTIDPTNKELLSSAYPDGTVGVVYNTLKGVPTICVLVAKGGKWWVCTGTIRFNTGVGLPVSPDEFKGLYIYDPKAVAPPSATILKTPQEVGNELGTTGFALMKVGNDIRFAADPAWGLISRLDITRSLKLPPGMTINDLKGFYFGPTYA